MKLIFVIHVYYTSLYINYVFFCSSQIRTFWLLWKLILKWLLVVFFLNGDMKPVLTSRDPTQYNTQVSDMSWCLAGFKESGANRVKPCLYILWPSQIQCTSMHYFRLADFQSFGFNRATPRFDILRHSYTQCTCLWHTLACSKLIGFQSI